MSKAKSQGTRLETGIVNMLHDAGHPTARRLAEGGSRDEGDVEFYDYTGDRWVIEAKSRQTLNVTRELAKAKGKASDASVALVWKRLVDKGGSKRAPDGEPVVVVLDWETWVRLLTS